MYCYNCGHEVSEKAVICPECKSDMKIDKPDSVNCLLSYLFPVVGIIMGIVVMSKKPVSGKAYLFTGIGAIPVWTLVNTSLYKLLYALMY